MTEPTDRYQALRTCRKLLQDLTDPGKTPRVPKAVRDRALTSLRHFPQEWELDMIADNSPELLDRKINSIYTNGNHK